MLGCLQEFTTGRVITLAMGSHSGGPEPSVIERMVLPTDADSLTLRELLELIVAQQMDDYSAGGAARSPLADAYDELGPDEGRIRKARQSRPSRAAAQQRVVDAVVDGTVLVFVASERLRELDQLVAICGEPHVMFVRLVKLRGLNS